MNPACALSNLAIGAMLFAAIACAPVEPTANEESTASTAAAKESVVAAHLPSTPVALQTEIDNAVEVVIEPWAGAAANRAMYRLTKISAPAVPSLLARMIRLDFAKEDERFAMPMLTQTLHDVVKSRPGPCVPFTYICRVGILGNEAHEIENCEMCRNRWIEWWNSPLGHALAARAEATPKSAK